MNDIVVSPLNLVDDLIQDALSQDDPFVVISEIKKLLDARELVGKTLAKALYVLHQNWYSFSLSEQEPFNDVLNASLNLHPHTLERYTKMWHYYEQLPTSIQEKPVREIIPITNMLSQDNYEITDEQWEKLEKATNPSEIGRIIREDIKNKGPRKSSIQIYLNQNDGTVYCWSNDLRHGIGFLDVNSNEEAVQKAISRITKNTGIMLK